MYKPSIINCIANTPINFGVVSPFLQDLTTPEAVAFYIDISNYINDLKKYVVKYSLNHSSYETEGLILSTIEEVKKRLDDNSSDDNINLTITYFTFKDMLLNYRNLVVNSAI